MPAIVNPTLARTPEFFRHCNEKSSYLRTEFRMVEAFELLGIPSLTSRGAIIAARHIWTRCNGPSPANFAKKDAALRRRKEKAVMELIARCPEVFQITLTEPNEDKFVRVRAPNAMIMLANMTLQRMASGRSGKRMSEEAAFSFRRDIEIYLTGRPKYFEDTAEEDDEDAEDIDEEDTGDFEDVAEEGTEDVDDAEMEDEIDVDEDADTTTQSTTIDDETTRTPTPVVAEPLFTSPPFAIEVRTAKKGLSLMKLDWKHVVGGGGIPSYEILLNTVRAFPLIDWPKKILFIRVVNGTNTFVFEQSTLETTFAAWREMSYLQRAPPSDTFLLYVSDYEGFPPEQIPGEAPSDS